MDRTERFYKIDHLLRGCQPTRKAHLLEALQVSPATLKRDLEYLRDRLNAPIDWHPDRGYHYREGETFSLPGLWLNAGELHALLTTQQLLEQLQPGLLAPHIQPLRQRIQHLLAPHGQSWQQVSHRVRILQKAARPMEPECFQTIAHALLTRRQLHIHYTPRHNNQPSERVVSPQRLVYYRDNWYLDAFCHLRQQLRSFSLDTIRDSRILDQTAPDLDDTELDQHLTSGYGIFAGSQTQTATLRFTPERARWVATERWHPKQQGCFDSQSHYLLEIPYADPRELIMDILKYGPDVEVLGPEALRQAVRERVRQTAEIYKKEVAGSSGEPGGGVE